MSESCIEIIGCCDVLISPVRYGGSRWNVFWVYSGVDRSAIGGPRAPSDVGAVLTYGAGGYEVVCDAVALARICLANIRTDVVRVGVQGIDGELTAAACALRVGRNKTRVLALAVVHPVILRHADSGGLLGRGPQGTHGKQSGGKDRQRRPSEVGGQHAEDGWRKRKKDGQDGKGQINVGCCLIIPGSWWQFRAAVILSKDRSAGSSVLGGDDMQS